MASWLKATEDLFEVEDRRADLVVTELSDEQSDSQSQGKDFKIWGLFACINQYEQCVLVSFVLTISYSWLYQQSVSPIQRLKL